VNSSGITEEVDPVDRQTHRSDLIVSLEDRRTLGEDVVVWRDPVMTAVPVSVVIPTLNEELNLPHVLEAVPKDIAELIIVDGHSVDATVEVAMALWPGVRIVHQTGKGKGNALSCGFMAATGDIVVMLDADGSTDPAEIPRFVAALITGADFAKGTRFITGGGSSDITTSRRVGNRILSGLVNVLWDTNYSDLCYGFNAFWRRCLPEVVADCSGFEVETLMNIRLARSNLRVVEVPSFEKDRVHGASNLRAVRDGIRVLRTIAAERLRPQ
jgi:glycosyltransferase involved in cell wall biosynthesis